MDKSPDTKLSTKSEAIFKRAMFETINTMTGFELEENKVLDNNLDENECIMGLMTLIGNKNIILTVKTDVASAEKLVCYMTGVEIEELKNEDICDGLSEIVNMIAGIAKLKLVELDCSISLSAPFTLRGKEFKIIPKKNVDKLILNFRCEDIDLKLEVYFL